MYFYVHLHRAPVPSLDRFPCVLLQQDLWDDFGYRTTFRVSLFLSRDEEIDLGTVKIMQSNRHETALRTPGFSRLSKSYASLGGGLDYYDRLFSLGPEIYRPYLSALRDVVFNDSIKASVEDTEVFRVSLMRFSGAELTLIEGRRLFTQTKSAPRKRNAGFIFRLKTSLGKAAEPFTARFDFRRKSSLPNRVNVVIGYNGTGKTRLLSNIATVVSGYGYADKEDALNRTAGRLVGNPPPFGSVIVVSYSAFDTFALPGEDEIERQRLLREGDLFGYVYCGLRERIAQASGRSGRDEEYRVRSPRELQSEFLKALAMLRSKARDEEFRAVIDTLLEDGSFQRSGLTPRLLEGAEHEVGEFFNDLSSGHKIVLKMVTELVAHLDDGRPSLVLLDEPETHLHPPLLSSLLRGLRACLDHFDGFAIIATHSPVVLQETPSRFVNVLQRIGSTSIASRPTVETFGETIGVITRTVFNLDERLSDWPETLETLGQTRSLRSIEAALDSRLGFAARSYFVTSQEEQD